MTNIRNEIRATIARLKREGEYEDYLTERTAIESAAIAAMLQSGLELTDQEVGDLCSNLPVSSGMTLSELEDEAQRAIERVAAPRLDPEPPLTGTDGGEDLAKRFAQGEPGE
jgi:hypothetical protein